ncbi:SSU ribosomal protein S12P methylthiotransferase [Motilibacter rhizosphaerae]|uniref:Ribosomal protein uS12 methylthiotransferase RimO n=1 Tax=Motilibacter rhizosphaerae TaxID=598652 RepID=A0A4Q7NNW4_9ACTN|nr:30S ribosomal protein S12 methylthiotransferase RimO [Motilibacter rhizosphaerae]RZS86931.1 SSU ribosomal protein S12P methylthiotransferase [Motilibacter rhizosphaerae]
MSSAAAAPRTVALVTLGCARNEVDSEELAGRLAADGWQLVDDAADADVAVVNTCGFVESAKKDSVDALIEAAELKGSGRTQAVVAVGCMAERYGAELAGALPEADAVLGFDDYADVSARLQTILAGGSHTSHVPRDRRALLPLSPVARQAAAVATPGHGVADLPEGVAPASGPLVLRRRLGEGPVAPLKLASGCDRRCAFCAIPSFRGAYVSRPPADVLAEARWLAEQGVREVVLVSENSSSYGKDLGDIRALEGLLPELAAVDGLLRVRVSYLQPAEVRPGLLDVMAGTPGIAPYFDLSFQHASGPVLRRMRRFGDTERFLELLEQVRTRVPLAGARSSFIVGFPGETEEDVAELQRFLESARLDAMGVFAYSDEEGTEGATLEGKLPEHEIAARHEHLSRLVEELVAQRAEDRIGETVEVLVEREEDGRWVGPAGHQAPEVDGVTALLAPAPVGSLVRARVVAAEGVDLVAEPLPAPTGQVGA